MTTIINAVSGTGLTQTADGSGIVKLQSNGVTTNALAWVNFNGTTSPGTIRSQYNVSSVTANGTGDFTINFTTSLSDANYSVSGAAGNAGAAIAAFVSGPHVSAPTTSAFRFYTYNNVTLTNFSYVTVNVFGN